MGVLGLVPDFDEARSIVRRLMAELTSGSYLAVYDGTDTDPAYVEAIRSFNARSGAIPYTPRSPEQIAQYFEGLDLVSPGVVPVTRWRPLPGTNGELPDVACTGGVARKP